MEEQLSAEHIPGPGESNCHCSDFEPWSWTLILATRGVVVSYETIRDWGLRFDRLFANELKRRRPRPGDTWHMDEVFIRMRGKIHYLWRAVDQDGHVLDILVQSRRNATAAKRFFRKLLKGLQHVPRVIVTDKLRSYAAAKHEILPSVEHRQMPLSQQPRRGVTPADTTTRTADAAVQVTAPRAAVPLHPQPDPQPLPTPSSPPDCQAIP
nr:IS6 family transposase [Roseomonas sp. SXEYE001]MCV4210261.1 IS6 family transposase [Roseomonas sp. SXEYE001]